MEKRSLLKSTMVFGLATAVAKLIGFAREIVLAAFYGAGPVADAFILAFTIPDTLLTFISSSSAASFIAMYPRVKKKTQFTRNIMTFLILVGLLFSVIFTVLPEALVKLFAFQVPSETFNIAVFFVRYMVWSSTFILLMGLLGAYLEVKGDFFSSGIRSTWRNITVIIGIVLGALTNNNLFIALAPVSGCALCVFSLSYACRRHGYVYRPHLDFRSPELKKMLLLVAPIFVSTAISEINIIVGRNFAASLPVGAISALNYSSKLAGIFVSLIGQPLLVVLFPHMSELAAGNDLNMLRKTLVRSVMYILVIVLPLCVGVIALAPPGVRILFERGLFTSDATYRTASCLRIYASLIVSSSISPLLIRAFFALQDMRTPARVSMIVAVMNIFLNFCFVRPFNVEGLALSTSLSSMLGMFILLILFRRKIGFLGIKKTLPELLKIALASGIMGILVWFAANSLPLMGVPVWRCALLCSILVILAALFYIVLLLLLRIRIFFDIIIIIIRFFEKKRKRIR